MTTAGDQVLENIIKGCKTQASKEIKADLAAGKRAAIKIKQLEAKINKYKALEGNFDREVRKARNLERMKLKKDKDILNKQRAHVIRAARKVARGIACMDHLKNKTMATFIKDQTNSWDNWANKEDTRALATIKAIVKQGIKEDK